VAAGADRRWRALLAAAVGRPVFDEPLTAERLRPVWSMVRALAVAAVLFDLGLWASVRDAPETPSS
jgi:hypothetical protein